MATSSAYDLIVVGSGFAGCMTALNFLEGCEKEGTRGRVAIVESGKEGERCGASRWTMAYLRLDKDLNFDEDWVKEMELVSKGQCDLDSCHKLGREARATAEYVQDHDVNFVHHDEDNVLLKFKTGQHFVFPEGGGNATINALMGHIGKYSSNCEIHWEPQARSLVMTESGTIRGIKARKSDGLLHDLLAPTVMLACGGFERNREMLAKYIGNRTHHLPLIAPGLVHNTGAGIKMALEVGAATSGSFDGIHCELVDTRATKPDANSGATKTKKGYFITDSQIMGRFRPGWVFDTTDQEPAQADTIRELAEKLGADPDALAKTVGEFNAAINDKPFDLMNLDRKATTGLKVNKTNWANPINKSPYFGYPLESHLTFTYGGLKIDTDGRVLGSNSILIPGLYAAGEITGLYYNEYPPATPVLRSLTFGRLAGEYIAKEVGKIRREKNQQQSRL